MPERCGAYVGVKVIIKDDPSNGETPTPVILCKLKCDVCGNHQGPRVRSFNPPLEQLEIRSTVTRDFLLGECSADGESPFLPWNKWRRDGNARIETLRDNITCKAGRGVDSSILENPLAIRYSG